MHRNRGSVSTLVALIGLAVIIGGVFAGRQIVEVGSRFFPKAALPVTTSCPQNYSCQMVTAVTECRLKSGISRSCSNPQKRSIGNCCVPATVVRITPSVTQSLNPTITPRPNVTSVPTEIISLPTVTPTCYPRPVCQEEDLSNCPEPMLPPGGRWCSVTATPPIPTLTSPVCLPRCAAPPEGCHWSFDVPCGCGSLICDTTPTPSGPTPTPDQNTSATIKFKLILPDISPGSTSGGNYVISVYQNGQEVSINGPHNMLHVMDSTEVDTPVEGVTLRNITGGTYSLLIKESHTIARRFNNIVLTPNSILDCQSSVNSNCGELSIDKVSAKPLLSGDTDGHNTVSGSYNRVDIADFAKYLSERLVDTTGRTADFNLDGAINTADLGILARNFNKVGD